MSYLVLARKYRPVGFSSVSGQEHVTKTLSNAITRDKVVHAYLFTGPRGVGKTSVARILSKAINCQKTKSPEPCQECQTCKEIGAGTSLAVREIDGASHNSVDNVRELMDSFKSLPPPGYRYKVYIIDEVHMLSVSAFNALLKSLEEPPPHTVFILATTEVHKIPETVVSRCQRHDFRSLSVQTIEQRLIQVCSEEGIDAQKEALRLIARLSDGSMRDAQTLLDRVQSFCTGAITADETSRALGTVERRALVDLSQAIVARAVEQVLEIVSELFATGTDPTTLLREFVNYWRELFVAKLGGDVRLRSMGLGEDSIVELMRLSSPLETVDVQDLWDLARDGADRCLRSAHPRYGFEALVVRMATRQPVAELGGLIASLSGQPRQERGRSDSVQSAVSAGGQLATVGKEIPNSPPPERAKSHSSNAVSLPSVKSPRAESSNTVGGLSWEEFLRDASASASKMLLENLKRVKITRLDPGVLEGSGPEFTINSLSRDKQKLSALLNDFLNKKGTDSVNNWKMSFVKGEGATENSGPKSSHARGGSSEVQGHPALQSLQKIFPGSKVEQVRSKE